MEVVMREEENKNKNINGKRVSGLVGEDESEKDHTEQ